MRVVINKTSERKNAYIFCTSSKLSLGQRDYLWIQSLFIDLVFVFLWLIDGFPHYMGHSGMQEPPLSPHRLCQSGTEQQSCLSTYREWEHIHWKSYSVLAQAYTSSPLLILSRSQGKLDHHLDQSSGIMRWVGMACHSS